MVWYLGVYIYSVLNVMHAFYHKFVHTHTHTLIPTSSACPHLISPHQHNQRCAGWSSSSSLFCQTLVHLLPPQPWSHLLQISSLKRNNNQNISGVLHSEMSFWPLELRMFVERFVAVLGPLSITFNSFVLFRPVVCSQQEKKSNKKCFSCFFLFFHPWPWFVSGFTLQEPLSPHCLTCMTSVFACKHCQSELNRVNKPESKTLQLAACISTPSTSAAWVKVHLFIKDGTTMSAEFAFGTTSAVLCLATKQGYVRKTAFPSCKQRSAGKHCDTNG